MSNFHHRLTTATLGGTAVGKVRAATVQETVGLVTSHAGGEVGPAARAIGEYDVEAEVEYETGTTPLAKTTAAGALVLTYKGDDDSSVSLTVANMRPKEWSAGLNSAPFGYRQKFYYTGTALDPITIAA